MTWFNLKHTWTATATTPNQVLSLDFSPDLGRMVTSSAASQLKVWNINVRYHLNEDPKCLLSAGMALPPGQAYSRLAWGPGVWACWAVLVCGAEGSWSISCAHG